MGLIVSVRQWRMLAQRAAWLLAGVLLLIGAEPAKGQTLLAEYLFEEGEPDQQATVVLDTSGFGNDGMAFGPAFYRADVPDGIESSLSLGLSGQGHVSFASVFPFHNPGDFTLEFWIKAPVQPHTSIFWTRSDASDINRFNVWLTPSGTHSVFGMDYKEPSGPYHGLFGNGAPGEVFLFIEPDTWTHVAVARSGNAYALFKDGYFVYAAIDANPNLPTATGWQFAGRSGYDFQGNLAEVRLWQGAFGDEP